MARARILEKIDLDKPRRMMKTAMKFVMLSVVIGIFAMMAVADTVTTPEAITVGCKAPNRPDPKRQTGLIRYKGDTNQWMFQLTLADGAHLVGKAKWDYKGTTHNDPDWGLWTFNEDDKKHMTLIWSSPNTTGKFKVTVSGKITCGDGGGGGNGQAETIDFITGWDGEVSGVKIKANLLGAYYETKGYALTAGQNLSLQGVIEPDDADVTGEHWTIDGSPIKNFMADENSGLAEVFPTNPTGKEVSFYWYNAGTYEVKYEATVNGEHCEATATFIVRKPTATLTSEFSGKVTLVPEDPVYILFGKYLGGNNVDPGIIFNVTIQNPDVASISKKQWVQTANAVIRYQRSTQQWYRATGIGLDAPYPYPPGTENQNNDFPGIPLYPIINKIKVEDTIKVEGNEKFTMWYMSQPEGEDSIFVPLSSLSWNWTASAERATPNDLWGGLHSTKHSDSAITNPPYPKWTANAHDGINNPIPE